MVQQYVEDLINCYSEQAEHFHHTRKKFWPEVDYLCDDINEYRALLSTPAKTIKVVDLGAGTGRLSEYITKKAGPVYYTGVDNAPGMTEVSKQHYPNHSFFCASMQDFLYHQPQESTDVIVALASFQHIQGVKEQQELLLSVYKTLKRNGICILVNWSLSEWFLKKYPGEFVQGVFRSIFKPTRQWNDLIIPRKDKDYLRTQKKYKRMYHMYTIHELKKLAKISGFVIDKAGFVLQNGTFSSGNNARRYSRNSYVLIRKSVK